MKTSTAASPKPPDPLSILLIGPPGGGKTTLAMEFPEICILDVDAFLDGPEKAIRKWKPALSYSYDSVLTDDSGAPIEMSKAYDRLIEKMTALVPLNPPRSIGLDSLTMLDEIISAKIKREQRRNTLELRDYDTLRSDLLRVLVSKTRALNRTTIYLVHEKDIEETDPRNIMNKIVTAHAPTVRGSVGKALGGFFSDVWRCTSKAGVAGKVEYVIEVAKTTKDTDLKNSIGFELSSYSVKQGESMFAKLEPFLKGRI